MKHESVQHLFGKMVESVPDNVAISFGDERITYRELEHRTDKLSDLLLAGGAQKNSIVAILLNNRVEAITSILAVLKAGAVFVPFDPQLPDLRLETMIAEVTPDWFITDTTLQGRLNGFSRDRVLNLDHLDQLSTAVSHQAAPSMPDDFCYVYFTSGSTGRPKGIAGRLKGIDHFIRWQIETLGIEKGTRVSQLLPLSFDGSLRDIFVPLCAGGTICVPEDSEIVSDARRLVSWLDREQINVIHCVPTLFRALLNEDLTPENFRALRYVLLAGEPLLPADVGRWMKVFGDRVKLINLYGTSETTMAKFIYEVQPGDEKRRSVPVGKPMPGARALIVDEEGRACPAGTIGEIYIRTPYRSLGYYKQPQLTAEVFIPNPFNNDPTDIVYKTGDVGRMLEDGNIELLGRQDQQVKIRGVRVELEEINNLLRGVAGVKDVAVVDRKDTNGGNYLCAYVVGNGDLKLNMLREHLQERLPNSMVPSAFLIMEKLPRTISGKLDRRALPSPEQILKARKSESADPLTAVEEVLAGLWCKVLGLEQVGVHDNFFELGGHSLLATQVLARVRDVFHVEVALRQLFDSPTISGLAHAVEIALRAGDDVTMLPIKRVSGEQQPLSYAQQRLWFIERMGLTPSAYNMPGVLRLRGTLSVKTLEQTLAEIIRRHEALRTSFVLHEGQPVQVVAPRVEFELPLIELSKLPVEEREKQATRLAEREAQRPFDLRVGPLLRVRLLRLSEQEHWLVFVLHHIVSDEWSTGVLIKETGALYRAYLQGEAAALPELAVQYADYAQWQREWMNGEVLGRELGYWKQQLAGAPAVLELPADQVRPTVQSARGASCEFTIDREVLEALKRLGRQEGATLFMVLVAAFDILLHRYTGQTDIVVGTPIANRTQSETSDLIGFFVNTLVLRTELSGEPSFLELLKRVREMAFGAYAHQQLPFERLVEELQPERNLSHTPLFQVMVVLHNAPVGRLELPGVELEPLPVESGSAKFDLTLTLTETAGVLRGQLEYCRDLFEATTIKQLLGHFENLLRGIVVNPEERITQLPLLSASESRQLLEQWNQTATAYPRECGIPQLFETEAERRPEAVAVVSNEQQLSYGELNERANQMARHLQSRGVGPETLVGVSLLRSEQLVLALLGILKAGGAYVFLDASYPPDRLRLMLQDAGVQVLVTQQRWQERFAGLVETVICVDTDAAEIGTHSVQNLETPFAGSEQLAYVSYTSGSTGRPKGVAVPHRGVVRLVKETNYASLNEESVFLQLATVSFDASTLEIWGPLLNGGCCVLPEEQPLSAADLGALITRYKVNSLWLTASLFNAIVDEDVQALAGLRQLLVGGEALSVSHIMYARADLPQTQLINGYGPTENTTFTCCFPLAPEFDGARSSIPIGPPIANTQVYILDQQLQPVPLGVAGELYIGGDGLARGYVGRPELTAEQFVPHPFSQTGGARLYRTGDLTRWLRTGAIEYLGRLDRQVKVRGFRIELAEIETVLKQHEMVQECVVLERVEEGEKRLVAYVRPDTATGYGVAEWRAYLKEKLPDYMIPAAFVEMENIPLTANGKVDWNALPLPPHSRPELNAYVAPRTALEELLADIWAEVLDVECVGVHDNFFDLGGHSLLATQVVSKVFTIFQIKLPILTLFEAPSPAGFAAQIILQEASPGQAERIARVTKTVNSMSDEAVETAFNAMQTTPTLLQRSPND